MKAWQEEHDADPEYQIRVAEWQKEKADFMATLDCECPWNCCEGNDTLRSCQSETLAGGFIHKYGCHAWKRWMEAVDRFKDGFELRGSNRDSSQYVRRKYTFDIRLPLCPACRSELKRRAAAKSAEARRFKRAERDIEIILMWDIGKSQRFIAKALGCSAGTINGALRRMATVSQSSET